MVSSSFSSADISSQLFSSTSDDANADSDDMIIEEGGEMLGEVLVVASSVMWCGLSCTTAG